MPNWGSYYWPIFLGVVSLLFLGPEIFALLTNSANTLSDYCWREMSVSVSYGAGRHTFGWWFSIIAFCLASVLLTIHIWFRGV